MSEIIRVRRRDSLDDDEVYDERTMMVSRPGGYPWSQAEETLLNERDEVVLRLESGEYAVRLESLESGWDVIATLPERFEDLEDEDD